MKHDAVRAGTSAEVTAAWQSPGSLWARLKAACAEDWKRYLANDFIWHIADGTLPPSAYRHFIEQDYLSVRTAFDGGVFRLFDGRSAARC